MNLQTHELRHAIPDLKPSSPTRPLERVLYNIEKIINPSPEELDALRRMLHPRVLARHEHFLREGEVCGTVALLEKGSVRLYYTVDRREICKDFCSGTPWWAHLPASLPSILRSPFPAVKRQGAYPAV